jgi:probable F420-dependent oxidoreductase
VLHGIAIFPTDETPSPADIARLVEERGFESLWYPDHTHVPSSRVTPNRAGGEMPRGYMRTLDPFVSLAAAAEATTTLRLGTGICLVTERDPIITAKEVASLDHLTGGRFTFGVGAGWNLEELANHGVNSSQRMPVMRERVEAMKEIWTQEVASYQGRYVEFDRIWQWPKPLQHPHPPIYVAGNGPTVLDRVFAFGDAWMPSAVPEWDDELLQRIEELHARSARVGREVGVTIADVPPERDRLERYAAAGVARCVHTVESLSPEQVAKDIELIWEAVS